MAKSRKSNKSTDADDASIEKPDVADKAVSVDDTAAQIADAPDDASQSKAEAAGDSDVAEVASTEDAVLGQDLGEDEPQTEVAEAESAVDQVAEIAPESEVSSETDAPNEEMLDDGVAPDEIGPEIEAEAALDDAHEATTEKFTEDYVGDDSSKAAAVAAPAPKPQQVTKVVRGSIWPGFFGGVIAALVGFIVGRGEVLDAYLPAALQRPSVDTSAFETRADEIAAQSAAQQARIEALETAGTDTEIPADIAALPDVLENLSARVDAIETRPTPTGETGASSQELAALQSALDAQKADLDAQKAGLEAQIADLAARAEAAEAGAAGEAARILARAALARVMVAVDSGETFSPALSDLEEVTPVDVPDPLRAVAETGVPTMAALQDSFPDAARAGLAAARADMPEAQAGVAEFLKRQLNVRSVAPREGDDPDAVLSRVQAAVRDGDLDTALAEADSLPDAARSAMADWLDAAVARKTAQDAAQDMADSLNSN